MEQFGLNLKIARKKKGMTQQQVADFIGISQNNYSYWENGKIKIDNISLQKLANLFEVTIDYLLGRETTKAATPPTKKNTVISIGRGGERREYEISDEDAAIVDAFLEKMRKKD